MSVLYAFKPARWWVKLGDEDHDDLSLVQGSLVREPRKPRKGNWKQIPSPTDLVKFTQSGVGSTTATVTLTNLKGVIAVYAEAKSDITTLAAHLNTNRPGLGTWLALKDEAGTLQLWLRGPVDVLTAATVVYT